LSLQSQFLSDVHAHARAHMCTRIASARLHARQVQPISLNAWPTKQGLCLALHGAHGCPGTGIDALGTSLRVHAHTEAHTHAGMQAHTGMQTHTQAHTHARRHTHKHRHTGAHLRAHRLLRAVRGCVEL